jgi:hypothetical protein
MDYILGTCLLELEVPIIESLVVDFFVGANSRPSHLKHEVLGRWVEDSKNEESCTSVDEARDSSRLVSKKACKVAGDRASQLSPQLRPIAEARMGQGT